MVQRQSALSALVLKATGPTQAGAFEQLGAASAEQPQNPQPRYRRTGLGRKAGGQAVADEVATAALVGRKGHKDIPVVAIHQWCAQGATDGVAGGSLKVSSFCYEIKSC